jgi:outer membrane receptor protein involved in Fe transport
VRYRADFATLQLGVANLFDKKPPEASVDASFGTSSRIGSVPTNRYDITGRRFFVRVTKSW